MKEETDYCSWRRELVACEKVLHSLTKGDCSFVLFLIYLIYYYFGYCLQERNKIGQKQTKQKKPKETTCVMKLSRCYHFFLFFFSCTVAVEGEKKMNDNGVLFFCLSQLLSCPSLSAFTLLLRDVWLRETQGCLRLFIESQARNNAGL